MASKVAINFFNKLAFGLGDDAPSPASPKPSGQLSAAAPAATPKLTATPTAAPKLPAAPQPAPTPTSAQQYLNETQQYAKPFNAVNNKAKAVTQGVEGTGLGGYLRDAGTASGNFFGGLGNTVKGMSMHALSWPVAAAEMIDPWGPDPKQVAADKANHPAGVPYSSPYASENMQAIGSGALTDAKNSAKAMWDVTLPRHERQAANSDEANTLAAKYDQIGLTHPMLANVTAGSRTAGDTALTMLPGAGPTLGATILGKAPAVAAVRPGLQALATKTMPIMGATSAAMAPRIAQQTIQGATDVANAGVADAEAGVAAEQQPLADAALPQEPAPPPELATISQGINATKGPDGKVPHGPPSPILAQPTAAAKDLVTNNPPEAKAQAEAAKARVEETLSKNKALASEAASWAKTGEVGQNTLNGAYKAVAGMVQDPSQIMPTLQNLSTPEMLGLGLGLGAGALGLMNLLGGKGGLGSMLMMLLGGGAAIAALGNNASGGQLGNYLGGMGADLSGAFNIYTKDPNSEGYAKQVAETAMTMPSVQAALPGIQKKLDKSNAGVEGAVNDYTGGLAPGLSWLAGKAHAGINQLAGGGDIGGINAAIRTETQRQAREELLPYMPWMKDHPEKANEIVRELAARGGLQAKYL